MMVETFEQHVERHPEACEEAAKLIAELGLEGQATLTSPDEEATRCPYRQWHADECEVYQLLCPSTDTVESYDCDTIPLRVLQVLSHAKSLGIYEGFKVLHAASPVIKDPVLVGIPNGQAWSNTKWHLLARWGAELDEFPVLVAKASKIKAEKVRAKLAGIRAEVDSVIAQVNAITESGGNLLGKSDPVFYANGW